MPVVDYCIEHAHILKDDVDEKFIPKLLWSAAIDSAISEDGGFTYELINVTVSIICEFMIDCLKHKSTLTREDACPIFTSREWMERMTSISISQEKLYEFMHHPDRRPCECMQYVVTAAKIGKIRKKEMRVSKNVKTCAVCNAALAKPKFCSRCKEVAYCSPICQKKHWKTHKKECKIAT